MLRTLVISAFAFCAAAAQAAAMPADTIAMFQGVLLENMKNGDKLGCAGRTTKLNLAVDSSFDLPFLAQRVLRRQWKGLSAEQQKTFLTTFRELVIGTYASQFAHFSGESFQTLDTQSLADGTRVVHASLMTGHNPVSFDYVLHEANGGWRIINVIAEGVSDLALRSTQYDSAFKAGGFDGLMNVLRMQIKGNKDNC